VIFGGLDMSYQCYDMVPSPGRVAIAIGNGLDNHFGANVINPSLLLYSLIDPAPHQGVGFDPAGALPWCSSPNPKSASDVQEQPLQSDVGHTPASFTCLHPTEARRAYLWHLQALIESSKK